MRWNPFRNKSASPAAALKSTSFLFGMGAGRGSLANSNYDLLAGEGYAANAVVNACINRIANSTASIDRKLYRTLPGGKHEEIQEHPLLDLLNRPNPMQSGDEFMRALVGYYLIGGNAYLLGNGMFGNGTSLVGKPKPPTELTFLMPGKVRVEPGSALFPKYYEYKATADKTVQYPVDQVAGRSAVLHLKTFNPLSQWSGLAPMLAAAYGIDINNAGQKWNKRLLDNDCRPSGAMVVKSQDGKTSQELSDDQYNRLKEMIEAHFSGAENAGRPMLLEGGLEWQQMSMNPKDMDWDKGKISSALDICMTFGVPPQLIGIPGSQTYANYEQANLSFWTDTVIPLHDWIQDALNRWLVPIFGDDLVLGYDKDSISALEPMRKEKFTRVQQAEFMTIDEKRRAVGMGDFPHKLGNALLLTGRGVLLGEDGSIVALAINTSVDSVNDPLTDNYQAPKPGSPQASDQTGVQPPLNPGAPDPGAKHKAWLIANGYTPERAERLTKLVYS
jgi:HK97 family phage portal protein